MTFIHLYYIPLVPIEARRRIHRCCNQCSGLRQFTIADFGAITERIKEQSAMAVLALQHGETTFGLDEASEHAIEALQFLESAVEWLHSSNEQEFIEGIQHQLDQPVCAHARRVIAAVIATGNGKLDLAIDHYREAARLAPGSSDALDHCGRLLVQRSRSQEAIEHYRSAATLAAGTENELPILVRLAEQLAKQKSWNEASTVYDRILVLQPSLGHDKSFSKLVAKAKQKSGRS